MSEKRIRVYATRPQPEEGMGGPVTIPVTWQTGYYVPRSEIEAVVRDVMAEPKTAGHDVGEFYKEDAPPDALREPKEPSSTPWYCGDHTLLIAAADGSITLGPQLAEAFLNLVHADRAMQPAGRRTLKEEQAKEDTFRQDVRELEAALSQLDDDIANKVDRRYSKTVPRICNARALVRAHLEKQ